MAENEISTLTEKRLEQMVSAASQVDRQAIEHYLHDVQLGNVFVSKTTLETALRNSNSKIREAAALLYTTGNLQEDISISVLVEGLRDESIIVQSICSIGLTKQGERAVPELESNLTDPDPKVRFWSAAALTNIDPLRWDVIETLRSAFNDKSSHKVVCLIASGALNKIMELRILHNQDLIKEPILSSGLKRVDKVNRLIKDRLT